MHIRNADQLENLTPADYIRWRSGVLTEIALELAQRFTEEEISWAIEDQETMSIIRARYHHNEYEHFAKKAGESQKDRVFFNMADALQQNFHTLEMVRMDGCYHEIFEKAIEYSRAFPYKTER
jgi:hypothetical protein